MVLLITYNLNNPLRDYTSFYQAIQKAEIWWHHLDSTWLIETNATPQQWHEFLAPHLDQSFKDFIFIIEVKRNYWGFLPKEAWEWLAARDFG